MKIVYIILFSLLTTSLHADWRNQINSKSLNKISKKVSSTVSNLIPGEGLTEVDVRLRDNNEGTGNFQFSILGVRDILSQENSNLFTQFSLHTQEINSDTRNIGNIGVGYRFLNSDKSMMFGINTFYDQDFLALDFQESGNLLDGHKRIGFGLEGKAAMLDVNFNSYQKITNEQIVDGQAEQVLSGQEYNISSQIPYLPWTTFNLQGYRFENEKAAQDSKGNIYSLEMALNPSLQFDVDKDVSSVNGAEDEWGYKLTFTHPPKENKPTLLDGAVAQEAFVKKNMQNSLKEKVRRNNNLAVEIQGSVIITSK